MEEDKENQRQCEEFQKEEWDLSLTSLGFFPYPLIFCVDEWASCDIGTDGRASASRLLLKNCTAFLFIRVHSHLSFVFFHILIDIENKLMYVRKT